MILCNKKGTAERKVIQLKAQVAPADVACFELSHTLKGPIQEHLLANGKYFISAIFRECNIYANYSNRNADLSLEQTPGKCIAATNISSSSLLIILLEGLDVHDE
jgi:hypothetical protein